MMYLVAKLCGPEDLVVDFCIGTIPAAKSYLLLSKHQSFLGCEQDEGYVKEAL